MTSSQECAAIGEHAEDVASHNESANMQKDEHRMADQPHWEGASTSSLSGFEQTLADPALDASAFGAVQMEIAASGSGRSSMNAQQPHSLPQTSAGGAGLRKLLAQHWLTVVAVAQQHGQAAAIDMLSSVQQAISSQSVADLADPLGKGKAPPKEKAPPMYEGGTVTSFDTGSKLRVSSKDGKNVLEYDVKAAREKLGDGVCVVHALTAALQIGDAMGCPDAGAAGHGKAGEGMHVVPDGFKPRDFRCDDGFRAANARRDAVGAGGAKRQRDARSGGGGRDTGR